MLCLWLTRRVKKPTLGYDAAGRLITVTDAEQHTTTLAYDAVNRLVKVTDALQRTVSIPRSQPLGWECRPRCSASRPVWIPTPASDCH